MCASWNDLERFSLDAIERYHRLGEQGSQPASDADTPFGEPCDDFSLAFIDFGRNRICCCGFSEKQHREEQE